MLKELIGQALQMSVISLVVLALSSVVFALVSKTTKIFYLRLVSLMRAFFIG
jgi:hypothetical protein